MVKPPRFQAMDNARQREIPVAFEKFKTAQFQMKKIEPKELEEKIPGPLPRPTFQILDSDGKLVAFFHPHGYGECKEESFKPIFDKMFKAIKRAANKALKEYERNR